MADNTFSHVCSLRPPLPPSAQRKAAHSEKTRTHTRLYAPLDYLQSETPAASAELLYVNPSGLFVTGAEAMLACVSGVEEGKWGGGCVEGGARVWRCCKSGAEPLQREEGVKMKDDRM